MLHMKIPNKYKEIPFEINNIMWYINKNKIIMNEKGFEEEEKEFLGTDYEDEQQREINEQLEIIINIK